MMASQRQYELGFTLQEVLIAVNVGFLIVSFTLTLYLSVAGAVGSWQKRTAVKNTMSTISYRIVLDAERSESFSLEADTALDLSGGARGVIDYRFTEGQVRRKSVEFNQGGVFQVSASLVPGGTQSGGRLALELVGGFRGYERKLSMRPKVNAGSESEFRKEVNESVD